MIVFTAAETETQLDVAGQVPNLDDMAKTAEEVGQNISHFNLMDFMTRYFPVMVNVAVTILVIILIWVIGKKVTRIVLRLFEKTAEINHFDVSVTKFLSILIRWGMYMLIICPWLLCLVRRAWPSVCPCREVWPILPAALFCWL